MTLDEIADLVGRQLRKAKERAVTTVPSTSGNLLETLFARALHETSLAPRLFFFRGTDPVATLKVNSGEGAHIVEAINIGAGGFDADVCGAAFDSWSFGDGVDPTLPGDSERTNEALQLFLANRAGDARWIQHNFVVQDHTIAWGSIDRPGGDEPTGSLLAIMKEVMASPSMTQLVNGPETPDWLKEAVVQSEAIDPVRSRLFQDVGTAMTLREISYGRIEVAIVAKQGSPRWEAAQEIRLPTRSGRPDGL